MVSAKTKVAVVAASAGILVVGYSVGVAKNQAASQPTSKPDSTVPTNTTTTTSTTPTTATTTAASRTITGDVVSHRYGTVQVTVTLTDKKITDVTARTTVYDRDSDKYTTRAVTALKTAVIAANSADVNTISGATYTSEAYLESLQSALDRA